MIFDRREIAYFADRIVNGPRFALVGYSDAEWYCIIKHCIGCRTGLGQLLTEEVGELLADVLRRRSSDSDFLFAVPDCMWEGEDFSQEGIGSRIDQWLEDNGLQSLRFFERDRITDVLAENAGLAPLITALRKRNVVIIGNQYLAELRFLNPLLHVEIPCPNYHLELDGPAGLDRVKSMLKDLQNTPSVFVVSAGVSASLLIDLLYDAHPYSSFVDCGSIWDAFVGVGCQREWRRQLYSNPEKLIEWKSKCLEGVI